MKKKTREEIWEDMTFGAWYIPFPRESNERKKRKRRDEGLYSKLKYCSKCDKCYEIDHLSRPRRVYYFTNVPKRQIERDCAICQGKNMKISKY